MLFTLLQAGYYAEPASGAAHYSAATMGMFVLIIVIGIAGYAVQARLQSVFRKYSKVQFPGGLTGAEVAEKIRVARGFGDLSENSEYDEAKNEQGKLYSRIAELEDILLHAVIVDESEMDSDKISIGCLVTVTNMDTRKQLPAYKIVGSQEADVMSRAISEDSPFGKALMGRKAGEEVTVEAPRGVIHYRVDKIER